MKPLVCSVLPAVLLWCAAFCASEHHVFAQNAKPAGKQAVRHETLWLLKRVGAPVPSPDGKYVVFSLSEPSYDDKEQTSDLWIMPADGSVKPRRLTASKSGESGVVWSPDSKKIAFTAKREGDEVSQIYVLDLADGGEAQRVTSLSTGASAPQWRPDGKALLFSSTVFPGAADDEANKKIAADRKARKYKARVYDGFPIRRWDRWLDDTEPHLFVQSLEPAGAAKDILAGTALVKSEGFGGVADNSSENLYGVWSPDGQSIVFSATTTRHKTAYADVGFHLWQIPASGGEPKQLTAGNDSYYSPIFAPNGKTLFCLFNPNNDKVYNLTRIAAITLPSGERKILTASFDRSVERMALAADGQTLYLTAEDGGGEKIYSLAASGGDVKPVMEGQTGCYTNLAIPAKAAQTVLFASWETAINPAEIVRLDPKTDFKAKRHQHLTTWNTEALNAIDWQPVRHFTFTSKGGKTIHNMIALPPDFDEKKKYPLFVLMHGGPHTMFRDAFGLRWNYHLLAQPGYIVLMTNYTGSTGFGEAFAQGIQGDPFVTPGNEINEAADEAIKRFSFVDAARQAAGGASYGGHLANWLQATTTRYKCLISHAGLINLESQWGTSDGIYHREVNNGGPVWEQGKVWREQNPIRYAKNFKTPILLTVGENDFRVPLNQTLENWSVLQRLQIPSKLIVFPDANHWILKGEDSRFFYQEVHAWLKKYVGN